MPVQPVTTLSRLLSSLPLPDAPYDRIAEESPDTAQYLRRLTTYLRDLVSKFATAEVGGIGGIPPVPDKLRNWELVFDKDDVGVEWRPLEKWWVTPDVRTGVIEQFFVGIVFPTGKYRVTYSKGGLEYAGVGGGWKINDGSHAFKIRHSDDGLGTFTDITGPGTDGVGYSTLLECEYDNQTAYVEFDHTGGLIGMYLTDSPLSDNLGGVTFSLERVS